MKEWFKYEFGYVNINDKNIYLTNSGNWSETKDLTEKTKEVTTKNDNKRSRMLGFFIAVIMLIIYLIYEGTVNGKVGVGLIIITVGGGYKVYQYLKTEIGFKFKIPFSKISEIKRNGSNAEIIFLNGEGNDDRYLLQRIDEKGISIIDIIIAAREDEARLQ